MVSPLPARTLGPAPRYVSRQRVPGRLRVPWGSHRTHPGLHTAYRAGPRAVPRGAAGAGVGADAHGSPCPPAAGLRPPGDDGLEERRSVSPGWLLPTTLFSSTCRETEPATSCCGSSAGPGGGGAVPRGCPAPARRPLRGWGGRWLSPGLGTAPDPQALSGVVERGPAVKDATELPLPGGSRSAELVQTRLRRSSWACCSRRPRWGTGGPFAPGRRPPRCCGLQRREPRRRLRPGASRPARSRSRLGARAAPGGGTWDAELLPLRGRASCWLGNRLLLLLLLLLLLVRTAGGSGGTDGTRTRPSAETAAARTRRDAACPGTAVGPDIQGEEDQRDAPGSTLVISLSLSLSLDESRQDPIKTCGPGLVSLADVIAIELSLQTTGLVSSVNNSSNWLAGVVSP
ncbi:uncharacterized protein LOC135327736 [Dromaius novaehollandiae]|uniref:uncharacterized protein LOC135327735 n=1 Tax=Dromaius novaehollandiae TaxID=8790 RepID=UPI00311DFC4D